MYMKVRRKFMTKEAKNILKKDVKKYIQLAEYTTDEENREAYQEIANYLEEMINEQEDTNEIKQRRL